MIRRSVREARSAVATGHVRYILGISLACASVGLLVVLAFAIF